MIVDTASRSGGVLLRVASPGIVSRLANKVYQLAKGLFALIAAAYSHIKRLFYCGSKPEMTRKVGDPDPRRPRMRIQEDILPLESLKEFKGGDPDPKPVRIRVERDILPLEPLFMGSDPDPKPVRIRVEEDIHPLERIVKDFVVDNLNFKSRKPHTADQIVPLDPIAEKVREEELNISVYNPLAAAAAASSVLPPPEFSQSSHSLENGFVLVDNPWLNFNILCEKIENEKDLEKASVMVRELADIYKILCKITDENELLQQCEDRYKVLITKLSQEIRKTQWINSALDSLSKSMEDLAVLSNAQKGCDITPTEAAGSLSKFCEKYCPEIKVVEAQKLAAQGRAILREIYTTDRTPPSHSEAAQEELAAITWFLMDRAIKENQAFHEGTFMIEDTDRKLYDYLCRAPDTIFRLSSHFIGRSPPGTGVLSKFGKSSLHHGVPVFNNRMPAHKRTILFELVDSYNEDVNLLFFKPENFHTEGAYDLVMHAKELLDSKYNKALRPGADEKEGMRKERVPDAVKTSFKAFIDFLRTDEVYQTEFLNHVPHDKQDVYDLDKALDQCNLWGVAYIFDFLEGLDKFKTISQYTLYTNPLEEMLNTYRHPMNRTGQEVYFTESELAAELTLESFAKSL